MVFCWQRKSWKENFCMAKNNEATDKQLRVLNFVNEQIKKEGYAPTVR